MPICEMASPEGLGPTYSGLEIRSTSFMARGLKSDWLAHRESNSDFFDVNEALLPLSYEPMVATGGLEPPNRLHVIEPHKPIVLRGE